MKELGRQVYLGGYEHEEHAAEAYDVAALKTKGRCVQTNFNLSRHAWGPGVQAIAVHARTPYGPGSMSASGSCTCLDTIRQEHHSVARARL